MVSCQPDTSLQWILVNQRVFHCGATIITTILWAFSFSFYGEYLAGHVDSYFAVLVRVGTAALVFLPFLRTRGNSLKTVGLYMLVGAMQLGVMYMLSFRAYLYLTVSNCCCSPY